MITKELTCVVCPAGCKVLVTLDENNQVIDVTGHTCPRGKKYAESEVTNPVRTLTSTVTVQTKDGAKMLPVRTDSSSRVLACPGRQASAPMADERFQLKCSLNIGVCPRGA